MMKRGWFSKKTHSTFSHPLSNESGLIHEHSPEAISRRLALGPRQSYLRDWVYGGIDGAVTTFAVVSGVIGASLPASTILILGLANLVADGFSMAAGNFLGTRSEQDETSRIEAFEREQTYSDPEGETEEVRQILKQKGLAEPLLEEAVRMLIADRERWVRLMLTEEYGLPLRTRSPLRAALSTLSAFVICGVVPLMPFMWPMNRLNPGSSFTVAWVLTGCVFFGIGSLKSRWSMTAWWKSGLSTLAIGTGAALLAYGVGYLLSNLADVAAQS